MKILVLTLYPLSSGYKARLEQVLGSGLEYKLVSELRHGGISSTLRYLFASRARRIVIPYEVAEGESVLSIVQLVALLHKFPRVEVCDPELAFVRVSYWRILTSCFGLLFASVDGLIACSASTRGARKSLKTHVPRRFVSEGDQRVLYIKNNLWFGLRAGGSVGHVAGVINGFVELGCHVDFVSPESPKYLRSEVHTNLVPLFKHFAIPPTVNLPRLQREAVRTALAAAKTFGATMVYQRLSMGDWSGAEVANRLNLPLVVEYNGSELWIAKNWGGKKGGQEEMEMMEEAILRRADLVFTVSETLRDQLVSRGLEAERIAWYPNCIDPTIYDPKAVKEADRLMARTHMGANDSDFVILFLGTFGLWHGAEIFADSAAALSRDTSWMAANRVRFAFVGDGKTREMCESIVNSSPASMATVFTGLVPQHEARAYLAAADAFVSPHVPNKDGSKFFGSPTKLFEYMAMAKPIVASALDQIAEVLSDGRTAILTKPGDSAGLAAGIRKVVEERDLGLSLGIAAREDVVRRFTWHRHVNLILESARGRTKST